MHVEEYKKKQKNDIDKRIVDNLRWSLESDMATMYLNCLYDSGKSFEYLTQQMRVGLCGIARQIKTRI